MKLLTKREAAERCRCSIAAFDAHVRPSLTPKKIGRRVLFLESELAVACLQRVAHAPVSRPSLRHRKGIYFARYRIGDGQREVSLRTADEFEAQVMAARLHDRLSGLIKTDGPGVYLVRVGASMKIGRAAKSIAQRVSSFQTANAEPVELLAVLSTDPADEGFYHTGMAAYRLRGEWFQYTAESIDRLARLVERGPR